MEHLCTKLQAISFLKHMLVGWGALFSFFEGVELVLKPMSDLHQLRSHKSVNDCSREYESSNQIEWIALNSMPQLGKDAWQMLIVVFLQRLRKIELCPAGGRSESGFGLAKNQNGHNYEPTKVFHVVRTFCLWDFGPRAPCEQ